MGSQGSVSADIGFCPLVAIYDCPLTAIRPLSVLGNRTFASATYRHFGDANTQVIPARHGTPAGGILPDLVVVFGERRSASQGAGL